MNRARTTLCRGFNAISLLEIWCVDKEDGKIKIDDVSIYAALVDLYNLMMVVRMAGVLALDGPSGEAKVASNLEELLKDRNFEDCAQKAYMMSIPFNMDILLDQECDERSFQDATEEFLRMPFDEMVDYVEEVFLDCCRYSKQFLASMSSKLWMMEDWMEKEQKQILEGETWSANEEE